MSSGKWTLVKWEEAEGLDDRTVSGLNLLYWSVMSGDHNSLSNFVDYLTKRDLLSEEVNKTYPNATLFHLLAKRESRMSIYEKLLQCNTIEESILMTEFNSETVFDLIAEHPSENVKSLFLTKPGIDDTFLSKYLQFGIGSEKTKEKLYSCWRDNFTKICNNTSVYEAILLFKQACGQHIRHVLNYEISRVMQFYAFLRDNRTLFSLLFRDDEISKLFFIECVGLEIGDNIDRQLEKYAKWRESIRFRLVLVAGYYQIQVLTDLLKKRTCILKYEMERLIIDGSGLQSMNITENEYFRAMSIILSDTELSDMFFMECLGFESGESEEKRIEKYQKWEASNFHSKDLKYVEFGRMLRVWERYSHIVRYEVNRFIRYSRVFHTTEDDLKEGMELEDVTIDELRIVQLFFEDNKACDFIFKDYVGFKDEDSLGERYEKFEKRVKRPLMIFARANEKIKDRDDRSHLIRHTLYVAEEAWRRYEPIDYARA